MSNQIYALGRIRSALLLSLFILATLTIFEIGNFSLSFFVGALLILLSLNESKFFFKPRGKSVFLLVFVAIALLSLFISVVPFEVSWITRTIQLIYWLLLSLFVYNSYDFINKRRLSMAIFWASLLFIILDVTVMPMSQNGVAFTVIIMGPLGLFYLRKYIYKVFFALVLVGLMLLNGSRTGAILSFLQTGLFIFLFTPRLGKYVKTLLVTCIVLILTLNMAPVRIYLGQLVKPVNEELGELLINPRNVFRNDKSWLQRRAQINKGRQIFKEHPVVGIGIFNFPAYNIDIDISNIETDRDGISHTKNRSAHNTYIALLSETGILGFSTVMLMFVFALWPFLKYLSYIRSTFEACVFISFIGLLAYFYLISGFFGTSVWIIYGLILGASYNLKMTYSTKNGDNPHLESIEE